MIDTDNTRVSLLASSITRALDTAKASMCAGWFIQRALLPMVALKRIMGQFHQAVRKKKNLPLYVKDFLAYHQRGLPASNSVNGGSK